jgi:hypothetical protein
MSFLQLKDTVRAALMVLAALMASSQTARAATIVLTCQEGNQAPYVLRINTDNNTVSDGSSRSGTYPVRITDEEMSWDEVSWRFSLNRITGNLHIVGIETAAGAISDDQCHKSEKKF